MSKMYVRYILIQWLRLIPSLFQWYRFALDGKHFPPNTFMCLPLTLCLPHTLCPPSIFPYLLSTFPFLLSEEKLGLAIPFCRKYNVNEGQTNTAAELREVDSEVCIVYIVIAFDDNMRNWFEKVGKEYATSCCYLDYMSIRNEIIPLWNQLLCHISDS